jgi:GNAT superfamily N-acetyltransferase
MNTGRNAITHGPEPRFRAFTAADTAACLALFDANYPEYFAPNERADYCAFLDAMPDGYEVCELDGAIVGAYGVHAIDDDNAALHWILLAPAAQGHGLGAAIMSRAMRAIEQRGHRTLHISASHKSAPFFARFGAIEDARIVDGWGLGMHRVEMRIVRSAATAAE